MAVTIKDIAEKAGVSRGTVDRALNNRGRINPEVAQRIRRIADEIGYVPRERRKKTVQNIKIGVVTQLAKRSFMLEVNRGIRQAQEELAERGVEVTVKEGDSVDAKEQAAAIDALVAEGINGLAVMPVDSELIRSKLNDLIEEKGIPVVTFNSDIVGTGRSCFVGMNNRKSGQTAAGLMGMLTRGQGKVLVITGFFTNPVNNMRVDGFIEELKSAYPDLELAGVQGSYDDDKEVEKIIVNSMLQIPGITGLFVVSGGQAGIRRAFDKLQLDRRPHTIIYDITPENKDALMQDVADFLIDQDGFVQGYEPPHILADLISGASVPETEHRYTDINIKTKYNL